MAESRCVFEDPDSMARKSVVVGTRHTVDYFLVRNARCDDAHIYASAGRKRERMAHLIRDDQIRGDKPGIFLCSHRHTDINIFSDMYFIHGGIRIGLYKSKILSLKGFGAGEVFFFLADRLFDHAEVFLFVLLQTLVAGKVLLLNDLIGSACNHILFKVLVVLVVRVGRVPHLKEGHCQALHCISLEPDPRILPVAKGLCDMEILVCQVVASGIAHLSVDHGDLAVIAVVQKDVKAGAEGIENTALNAIFLCALDKVLVDEADTSHVIIEDADFDACLHPFRQDIPDRVPALGVLDRMVLHEDIFLRLCHIPFLCFDSLDRVVKILNVSIFIYRIRGVAPDIIHDAGKVPVLLFYPSKRLPVVRQHREKDFVDINISLAHLQGVPVQTDQKV